jgi:hypothetical protein
VSFGQFDSFTAVLRASQAESATLIPTNDGYYWFSKPISEVKTFTASFANPIQPIYFPAGIALVPYSNLTITVGATTRFSTFGVGWQVGQRITVSNFNTTNPVQDANIINFMNRPEGHLITGAVGNDITIDVNTTGLVLPANPFTTLRVVLRNLDVRMIIPLEIITLQENDSE